MANSFARTPLRARLSCEALEDRLAPAIFTVTNADDAGTGSLRAAITAANTLVGADTITFNIAGAGVHTVNLTSGLPSITDQVTVDGSSQPGSSGFPRIELNGAAAGAVVSGFVVGASAAGSIVRGFVINRFTLDGVRIEASNCVVARCFIGTDLSGTISQGNAHFGVLVTNGADNVRIGGIASGAGNLISGNLATGIVIDGVGTSGTLIQGNFIGTDAIGNNSLGNIGHGVFISAGAVNNVVGGTIAGARNVISGNTGSGVDISDAGTNGNSIQGNFIGTDRNGTFSLGNSDGVSIIGGASNNTIGGTIAGARNVISGNISNGVIIDGVGTTGNLVRGNFIGTDRTGAAALGNPFAGVYINVGAANNTVGGTAVAARNIISGNTIGVVIDGVGSSGNKVRGNFIGTDRTGTAALGNSLEGVVILRGATNNVVGGAVAGAGNVISGNSLGVMLRNAGTSGNRVRGNRIGLSATSAAALGNASHGVFIFEGAAGNAVGGTAVGAGNVIAHNGEAGVLIGNDPRGFAIDAGTGNSAQGNRIFANGGLGIDLGTFGSVTANDLDDTDAGPNNLQNFPVLTLARLSGSTLSILGSINTQSGLTLRIEFFATPAADASGNGEGRLFLGFITVAMGSNNTINFSSTLAVTGVVPGQVVTATATDQAGNTSEFSLALLVI